METVKLTDAEMAEIAELDKSTRCCIRTDAMLNRFAARKPEYGKA